VESDDSSLSEGAALDFGRMRMNTPTDPMIVEERNRVIEMLNLGKLSDGPVCCNLLMQNRKRTTVHTQYRLHQRLILLVE
jgi:hypothetical protein